MLLEGAIRALLTTLDHGCERAADGAAVCLEKLSSHREVAEEFVSRNCILKFLKALDERADRVQLTISRILFCLKAVKPCFLQNLASCGMSFKMLCLDYALLSRGCKSVGASMLARCASSQSALCLLVS